MANYTDQFYVMDPGNPPAAGTYLDPVLLTATDRNNDNWLSTSNQARDSIDGSRITSVWVGDTVTVTGMNGVTTTITGVTFYLADGRRVFTPTDGSKLHNATFVSSTYVNTSTQIAVGSLGPPCFTSGTMILTPTGERPVETLVVGDLVETRDAGAQPILWTGQRNVAGRENAAPVSIATGALGNRRALRVSQQHRMLIGGWRAELYGGADEVLVAARHLVNGTTIRIQPCLRVQYHHLLLGQHHVLTAEGAPTESFFPGDTILESDRRIAAEIARVCAAQGIDLTQWRSARKILVGPETRCLAA